MVFKNRYLLQFLAFALTLLVAWFALYNMWLKPLGRLDEFVINSTLKPAARILEAMGYTVYTGSDRLMGIDGTNGIWMGDNCNGISLFAVFSIILISFPGNRSTKIWFIPAGILLIHSMNILRIIAICLVQKYAKAYLDFNHNVTFQLLMYFLIFMLWITWINKFSGLVKKKNNSAISS